MQPFQVIPVGLLETNCILVKNPGSDVLYVIDPGGDWKLVEQAAKGIERAETRILLTHAHVDHISAVGAVAKALGVKKVYLHPDDVPLYRSKSNEIPMYLPACADLPETCWPLEDPDVQVLECPGHTPGGVSYYFPKLRTVFCGDTLFYGSVGRTDLPGGDPEKLSESIRAKLFALPDGTRAIPGHGPDTSIGYEKKYNRYVD